jgi:hypothetical protein
MPHMSDQERYRSADPSDRWTSVRRVLASVALASALILGLAPLLNEHLLAKRAFSVVFLALLLLAVLLSPEMRWRSRPWFIKGPPRRGYVAAFFAVLLVSAIVRAVT